MVSHATLLLHGKPVVEQSVVVQPATERPPHQLSLMQLQGRVVVSTLVPADMHEGLP